MNLRSIDLNLLVVLQALLAERHVSKAAKRVGLSQPALSNALERLRVLFDDPILIRHGNRLMLSPKAERLVGPLNDVLAGVEAVVGLTPQPLSEIRQTVTLTSGDYALAGLLPELWQLLKVRAPHLSLHAKPWPGPDIALRMVVDGTCDLMVAPLEPLPAKLHAQQLSRSSFVGIARPGHPILKRSSRERFVAHRHVVVSSDGLSPNRIDLALRRQGIVRNVGVAVPSHMLVAGLVASSDLLGIVPDELTGRRTDVAKFRLPFELPDFDGGIVWHERSERDVAIKGVRDGIIELVQMAVAAGYLRACN
jgi:DNA-binding transcriptional LysR family regulator